MFANRAGVEDRTTILASLSALISRLGLTDAEFLSLAANVVAQELPPPASRGPSARTPIRDNNGWNEEHEFRAWRKLFEIEMEEQLVRAHKDYNESVQSGLNSAVQLLSAIVTGLGTVSLVLFSTTREEYVLHNSSTGESDVEIFERKLGDTGIFSVRWWFDIAITLASLLATGLSGVAGRRATRTGELTRQCEAFMNSRQDLIKRYREALEAPLSDRKSYKDFRESVRDLETREDQFVGRTLSNTQRFFALYTIRLWDRPAYHRYFRFCVVCALPRRSNPLAPPLVMRDALTSRPAPLADEDRHICGCKCLYLLNFLLGPVIKKFEFPQDRFTATVLLYQFSGEQLCAHISDSELEPGQDGQSSATLAMRRQYRKGEEHAADIKDINMNTVNMALDKLAADLRRKASLSRLFGTETGGAGQCLARHDPAGGGGSQPARRHSHADVSQPAPAETFDV